jgi:hypothetical protein
MSKVYHLWPVLQANFIKPPLYYRPSLSFYLASKSVSQKFSPKPASASFAATPLIKHKTAVQMMLGATLQRMFFYTGVHSGDTVTTLR